jgi:ribosomal protein L32
MMDIDEAIKHAEEVADECTVYFQTSEEELIRIPSECAEEHRQIAEWLKELKALREKRRPHGEWVKDFNMDKTTVCSKCGEEAWYKEYCGWVTKSNFCPNCGADMRKEGEAE